MPYVAVGSGTTTGTVYQNNNRFKPLQNTAGLISLRFDSTKQERKSDMNSKKVAKVEKKGSALRAIEWNPHSIAQALAKKLMPRFMAKPEKWSEQALDEFVGDFGKRFVAERQAFDAEQAAADASPIRRAEKKNRIKTERGGKIRPPLRQLTDN